MKQKPWRMLQLRAGGDGALDGAINLFDDEIEMHGGPVARVTADLAGRDGRRSTGLLGQQIERRWAAEHFNAKVAELPSDTEPEGRDVELPGSIEVVHVQVDEKFHVKAPQ
jgi:hypothetical protein